MDLGLPSGTLWATMNVGASKPSDYGLLFQWGDTQGYTKDQVGKDKQFNWRDYKFSINGSNANFTKYTTTGSSLELEDDAAHVHMSGDWHMPTPNQINELISPNNTTTAWTAYDSASGMTFTSKRDISKSIFIPAVGYGWNGSVNESGVHGSVWSSMLGTISVRYAQGLDFTSGNAGLYEDDARCLGYSVRGVIG